MRQKVRCQVDGCSADFPRKERYKSKNKKKMIYHLIDITIDCFILGHILSHHQMLGPERINALLDGIKDVDVEYANSQFHLNILTK